LHIGNNTVINPHCYLDNRRGIYIGNNVVISHHTKIYTLGHDYNHSEYIAIGAAVKIEDFVVVFSNVLIMPGVTIKKGAVILSGSVVVKDVEEMDVMGG
jgi:acetyltransferase-like isoleucine patch superfamily enzyme